jgi:hypothetical protein
MIDQSLARNWDTILRDSNASRVEKVIRQTLGFEKISQICRKSSNYLAACQTGWILDYLRKSENFIDTFSRFPALYSAK